MYKEIEDSLYKTPYEMSKDYINTDVENDKLTLSEARAISKRIFEDLSLYNGLTTISEVNKKRNHEYINNQLRKELLNLIGEDIDTVNLDNQKNLLKKTIIDKISEFIRLNTIY